MGYIVCLLGTELDIKETLLIMYPWCSGNIIVSKTIVGGSSPSGYANKKLSFLQVPFFSVFHY